MKEYITQSLYNEPNLTIGSNGKSLIFGQNDKWIVMDKGQLLRIEKHFGSGNLPIEIDDIHCKQVKDMILVSQLDNLISVKKGLLSKTLLK